MSVTQVYKKPKTCCSFDCQQGRLCPLAPERDSDIVNVIVMVVSAAMIAAPFVIWAWGL